MGVKKLSFASPEVTAEVTGMMIGGVAPFGLPQEIPVLADDRLLNRPHVIVGAGTRSAKLQVDPQTFARHPQISVVSDLAVERF